MFDSPVPRLGSAEWAVSFRVFARLKWLEVRCKWGEGLLRGLLGVGQGMAQPTVKDDESMENMERGQGEQDKAVS